MSKLQNLLMLIFDRGRKHKPVNIAGCSSPTWTVMWKVINMHRAPRLINVMRAIKMGSQSLHTFADDTPVQLFSRTRDHLARGTYHLIRATYHLVRATYHLVRGAYHLPTCKSHLPSPHFSIGIICTSNVASPPKRCVTPVCENLRSIILAQNISSEKYKISWDAFQATLPNSGRSLHRQSWSARVKCHSQI